MSESPCSSGGDAPPDDVVKEDMTDVAQSLLQDQDREKPKADAQGEDDDVSSARPEVAQLQPNSTISTYPTHTTEDAHPDDDFDIDIATDTDTESESDSDQYLRPELFASHFIGQEVELQALEAPLSLVRKHPKYRDDIFAAYMQYTTFNVTVWVNFDAAEQVFFSGKRAEACGKLRLPFGKREELAASDPDVLSFHRVRFYVSTPFRRLAHLDLEVVEREDARPQLRVDGEMLMKLERLRVYLVRMAKVIAAFNLKPEAEALTFRDLEIFASWLCRDSPAIVGSEWEQPAYGGGEWAGVEEVEPEPEAMTISRWLPGG